MSHKHKIASGSKGIYFLVLSVGILVGLTVLFSLITGIRLNFIFGTLLQSAAETRVNISKARFEFYKSSNDTSVVSLNRAWENIIQAELHIQNMLEKKAEAFLLELPVDDLKLREMIQELQVLIIEYKSFSGQYVFGKSGTPSAQLRAKWEALFSKIASKTDQIEHEIRKILAAETNQFKVIQFVLVGLCIIMAFSTVIVFYRYEKLRTGHIKQIESFTADLEKGLHKKTRAEAALQEAQRQFTTLIQNLPGMVYRCRNDAEWTMEFVSDKCFNITGYKANELLNNRVVSYASLINKEDRPKVVEQIKQAVEERKPFQLVYRINTSSGYERWVWEQGIGIYSENQDELVALEGFITDITEQKVVQDQIALQSNALEVAANGIVILDSEGKVTWCNTSFMNLTGYTLHELMGKTLDLLKTDEFPAEIYDHMWTTATGGKSWHGELMNKRKDGSLFFEEITITPIKSSVGEISYFVAIIQDITERRKADEALRDSELRFRGLYENATIGIYRTSLDGQVLMANPTLLKILGYSSMEDVRHINARDSFIEAPERDNFVKLINEKGKVFGLESRYRKADGSIIFVRESARLVRDNNGNPLYYEGTIEDITDKKRAEKELIEAKERAEQSNRLKSEFLAQMSHEIRTPLNVILSFTNMMKEELKDQVDEELRNGFDVIEVEGKRIMRTIELIINMSELQTGSYNIRPKRLDLYKDVIAQLYNSYLAIAESKKIEFLVTNKTADTFVTVDEYSANQIFHHLIDNAVKYTSSGKVEIVIDRSPRNNLYVDVIDSGIGISEDYLAIIFTPFTKEETGYTRTFEGNGLGLALAKKYCELNNAEIRVSSRKGAGSRFRVTFLS